MTKKFTFVKEESNRWYVVLPEWEGDKEELEMVLGADTMLDILSQGEGIVDVLLSEEPFENYRFKLTFMTEESGGGWYMFKSDLHDMNIWLCHVTKFVFGDFPKTIYGA
jgi:hypothetical protein